MPSVSYFLSLLLDPRGRTSRTGLLITGGVVLLLESGLSLSHGATSFETFSMAWVIKAAALWIGVVGVIKRLHDANFGATWILAGMAGLCMWSAIIAFGILLMFGGAALEPGSFGYVIIFAIIMLPAIGVTLWLHLTPGDPYTNRYGAVPQIQGLGAKVSADTKHIA
jgi:uncharacterized membrane protein YhaH (DUF805 family)